MNEKVVVLSVKSQKVAGEKIFRLHKKRIVLGSATSSDVRLDDEGISPVHAILEVSGLDGRPVIYDLASDTGIKVNGQTTVQASLGTDDRVFIGPFVIAIKIQELSTELPKAPQQLIREAAGGQKLFMNEKEDLKPLLLEDEQDVIEIFDRGPESKQSLQVVMFYNDMILDVEHFVGEKRVVIGPGSRDDFSIPPFFGKGRYELVTRQGQGYDLHLHEQMDGVLSQNGRMVPVRELVTAMKTGGPKSLKLQDKDFAKVKLKNVSFFLNFSPAPPKLRSRRVLERDPFFTKVWFSSLAMTIAALVGVSSVQVNPTIEIEQLPERVATIIFETKIPPPRPVVKAPPVQKAQPEQAKPVEPPKVVKVDVKPTTTPVKPAPPKPVIAAKNEKEQAKPQPVPPKPGPVLANKQTGPVKRASGQEGAGVKAQGTEGSRGAPNKPKAAEHQTMAQRPGEGPKTGGPSSGKGNSETNDLGVVDVFKSNKGTLSKILAGGKGVSNAAAKLEGYSGFTSEGAGGLGAAGVGKGGGGTSMGLGGLSDHGVGGGRRGTGLGALGSGGNILGGTGRLAIDSGGGSSEPIVLGAIDTDAIAREIAKHRDEIKYCYEKEINAERPDLAGRVGVRFVIGASGTVTSAGVSSTSLRNAGTERCVIEVIRRIQFPPVRGGGIAEVTYPFVFKPSNK